MQTDCLISGSSLGGGQNPSGIGLRSQRSDLPAKVRPWELLAMPDEYPHADSHFYQSAGSQFVDSVSHCHRANRIRPCDFTAGWQLFSGFVLRNPRFQLADQHRRATVNHEYT